MTSILDKIPQPNRDIVLGHLQSVPVRLGALAKDLGVSVKVTSLKPGYSGEISPSPDAPSGFVIRINRHEPKHRQRFTLAHEIAHFLLHRDQIGAGLKDDILYRSGLSDRREAEANRLAAKVIMPDELVNQRLQSLKGVLKEEVAQRMAEEFGVSETAMRIRLGLEV